MARPGIEPRTSDLRVRCPTDCATRPGLHDTVKGKRMRGEDDIKDWTGIGFARAAEDKTRRKGVVQSSAVRQLWDNLDWTEIVTGLDERF